MFGFGDHNQMGYGVDMGFGWIFMILFWVLLLGALIWFITWLVMGQRGRVGHVHVPGRETPLEILDRRLANGEISVEEHEKARQQLTSKPKSGG